MRTKILFKVQVIYKWLAVKSYTCLSELPGIYIEGSFVQINGAAWNAMRETR